MSQILIVDDNQRLARALALTLKSRLASSTHLAFNLDQAYQAIDHNKFELVILDWILTDGEGIELIPYLLDYSAQTKILMLTQKFHRSEKIKALCKGVDDYLCKPFSSEELVLRCQSLLTKFKLSLSDTLSKQGLTLSLVNGQLLYENKKVAIPKKELEILRILLINSPRVVSKQALISQIWTELDNQPQSNTIEVYIRRIRMKLGPYSSFLKTKRGFGYYFSSD